ncbi:hypothetical protein [Nocardia transvalensis]|uniref:hypothetical protein n=1 Tax=Nocardia transvalensis TaxID=37333 RepID=UPI001893FD51|nr:hypothetical protein [Nocardia transvalensis]MBF6332459.1 hypothetical protein [Nocardia transvalensis]
MSRITIAEDQIDAAVDVVLDVASDCRIRPYLNYSGRGMFGATCVGVVVERSGHAGLFVMALAEALADANDTSAFEEAAELFANQREDAMGLDTIVYWPNLTTD